ncbi:MAG TPA: FAD-dependent oxidoreductase [Steroidobacteraceae bacterium]|nr:FAD-dependent oxidoreductase [Steroidobacteraceae bacterium]
MDTDVLIVGAGPTGLMLANQLVRRGVRILLIDRHSGPAQQTRALGVQARTLEIYAQLGIATRALELGKVGTGANIWASGRHMGQVQLSGAGQNATPYPYIFILGQDDNERLMGERLREQGAAVTWNTELVGLAPGAESVTARLKGPDGAVRGCTAAWVAGCDGAHSAVRTLSGISFPGAAYEHTFFVADVQMTGGMVPDEVNVYLWRRGFHLLFPMRGRDHWRIVGIVPEELREQPDLTFEAVVPSVRHEAGDLAFQGCSWFSIYRIHHRAAAHFRAGRCFVLGDAAHVHSPVGAQGMNTGLQDAYNLAWKLALVANGQADAALLDTYEEERLPVARRLLNTTDRAFRLVVSDSRLAGLLRTQVLARLAAFAMSRAAIQRAAFRIVSQIGIHYRQGRLAQASAALPGAAPQAGDRFPWLHLKLRAGAAPQDLFTAMPDLSFHLIAIGQDAPTDELGSLEQRLQVHVIPDDPDNERELARVHIPRPAFYLLRPDGHVGLCGRQLAPGMVRDYLRLRLGARL